MLAPMKIPVRISAEFFMARVAGDNRYRPRDIANGIAALKAAIDGIVDAGVIPDDSAKIVQWGDVLFHRDAKTHCGRACVVLRLETEER
jgi:hypothetical protein